MNKYITLIIIFLFSFTTLTFGNISLFYDGEPVDFNHSPVVVEERVFYPMRELSELFGGTITWDQSTGSATTTSGENTVQFTLNSSVYVVNGNSLTMDNNIVPVVVNESIYLPIRYLAESLNFLVGWNYEKQAISVDSPEYYLENPSFAEENDRYILKAYLQYLRTLSELLVLIESSSTVEDKNFYTTTTLNYVENINLPVASPKIKIYGDLLDKINSNIIEACNIAISTGDFDVIDKVNEEMRNVIEAGSTYTFFTD